jgi:hypothetical protein
MCLLKMSPKINDPSLFASQLKAFYVDLIVPLENNLEKDVKIVQVHIYCSVINIIAFCTLREYFHS